ncbi:hypothetical protein [Cupriavidus taiwanensis]|uniref:hypothetical protein n=1 Tax=Cupriavidus taiwanensis TaxID=164546 RepID=UPI000E101C90|nr:hypothetical protein [Cupriavidus taiwanensis]SPA50596.1 conserved protein of unknown function [Cupriavidus taiwanensis]
MLALIDGDEAIYKACVIKVEDTDWESETIIDRPPTLEEAVDALKRMLDSWMDLALADEFTFCLSPTNRTLFRRGIYPQYKGGRSEKPDVFWQLEEWVKANMDCTEFPGLEADDVMGCMSGDGFVIVSSDKDMKTVPGRLVNPGKKEKGVISPARADWQWMYQTLMGDATDGFKGCIGCGPKAAEDILNECSGIKEMAVAAREKFLAPKKGKYKDITQTVHDFRVNAVMARILRPGDYNPATGDVKYDIPGVKSVSFNADEKAA